MIARILVLLVGLVSGTATSQLPEFAQQYRQRLGGTIDALQGVMADFREDASAFGLSVEQAIGRLKATDDAFARKRGASIERTQARLDKLETQQTELQAAGPFVRLGVFVANMDTELAEATARDYEPAVPVTSEGLASAAAGLLAGLFLGRGALGLARRGRRRRQPGRY